MAIDTTELDRGLHLCLRSLYHLRLGDVARATNLAAEVIDPERKDWVRIRGQGYWLVAESALLNADLIRAEQLARKRQQWTIRAHYCPTSTLLNDLLNRIDTSRRQED